jgi:hypothetical protein
MIESLIVFLIIVVVILFGVTTRMHWELKKLISDHSAAYVKCLRKDATMFDVIGELAPSEHLHIITVSCAHCGSHIFEIGLNNSSLCYLCGSPFDVLTSDFGTYNASQCVVDLYFHKQKKPGGRGS